MSSSTNCEFCKNDFPVSRPHCPHCARPSLFPNVRVALDQQDSLQKHYAEAKTEAKTRGADAKVEDFEKALDKTFAVINRPLTELQRLVGSDNEIYPTYYHLSEDIRLQKGEKWDSLRQAADAVFFAGYQKEIRFAVLSRDSDGLKNYGDCSFVLRENMISHRTTLFVDNTTLYYLNNPNVRGADDVPEGYRAVWDDRAKLCVAKLAKKVDNTTTPAQYSGILLNQGATSAEDDFIEVHIYGSMTIRTIEEISFNPVPDKLSRRQRLRESHRSKASKRRRKNTG